ncbi:pilin [Candidatus Methylobacter oryzae]|uniref:Prepilin-type N-terminal cleavage/methylation domain-containing protein n=1 Tax=Candidatus Methylobacter oryzae TaxID=2497749 RepID=A0ABY3CDT4_9GAMM|nr:prepilin-type N-terminal cleavage/methylation domain-containing protein [Candidatus Methylobacter oryzae]TRX00785.1 prepilin-type N-terminal cleavage/methylation domain-containing protein [Candidatus Methylobacter oryzae]
MNTLSMQKSQQGFTLIELMIVVAIIGILASIALPAYKNYTTKARFTEIVMAATAPKTAVEVCAQTLGIASGAALSGCTAGSNGVPADLTSVGNITSVTTSSGLITVTPNGNNGIAASATYVLTPTVDANGKVNWSDSASGCKSLGLC